MVVFYKEGKYITKLHLYNHRNIRMCPKVWNLKLNAKRFLKNPHSIYDLQYKVSLPECLQTGKSSVQQ
jgi:hypothetical protein